MSNSMATPNPGYSSSGDTARSLSSCTQSSVRVACEHLAESRIESRIEFRVLSGVIRGVSLGCWSAPPSASPPGPFTVVVVVACGGQTIWRGVRVAPGRRCGVAAGSAKLAPQFLLSGRARLMLCARDSSAKSSSSSRNLQLDIRSKRKL